MSNSTEHIKKHGQDSYLGKKLRKKTEKILLISGKVSAIRHIEDSTGLSYKECREVVTTIKKRLIQCGRLVLEQEPA